MGPWYYEVVSFDGDYVNLRRTDIESDELNPAAFPFTHHLLKCPGKARGFFFL